MTSTTLKIIAMLLMIFDHTVSCFGIGSETVIYGNITLCTVLRWLTRMSFPLFAFGIVEGFRKTHNRKNYGIRLLILAIISEIPWNLRHGGKIICGSQNVVFTLFFGFLGLCVVEKIMALDRSEWKSKEAIKLALALLALFAITLFGRMDYGANGFAFILLLYLLRVGIMEEKGPREVVNAVVCSMVLGNSLFVLPAFLFIHWYNGEIGWMKGRIRYLFYLVYPLHQLVLWYLRYVLWA